MKKHGKVTGWLFQPISKKLVKLDHETPNMAENKTYLKFHHQGNDILSLLL